MANNYIDGYINQLIDTLLKEVNPMIVSTYRGVFPLDMEVDVFLKDTILGILTDYEIIAKVDNEYDTLPILQEPKANKVDALRKRRSYQIKKIMAAYDKEKEDYFSGRVSEKGHTPFSIIQDEATAKKRSPEEIFVGYDEMYQEWAEKLPRQKSTKVYDYTYICDYPFIGFYKPSEQRIFFDIDITDNIIGITKIIDIKNYAEIKPNSTRNTALYRQAGKLNIPINEKLDFDSKEAGEYAAAINEFVDNLEPGSAYLDNFTPFQLDEKGSRLINYLSTECRKNYYLNGAVNGTMEASGTLKDIVEILWPNVQKYSSNHYKKAKAYLYNLNFITLSRKDETSLSRGSLFQGIYLDAKGEANESQYFKVVAGMPFQRDILEMDVSTIISTTINKLNNDIARLLYQDMKQDRTLDQMTANNRKGTRHFYELNAFQLKVRVTGKNSLRIKKYSMALDEMIENHVLIESYEKTNGGFMVVWIPLSDIEYRDIIRIEPRTTPLKLTEITTG